MELKRKVVRGVAWSTAEKVFTALLQIAVSLVLLSKLSADDYGTVAVVAAFPAILLALVDSGFSQALIRKKEVTETDYSSVFYINVVIAVALYLVLLALTPWLSKFYDNFPFFGTVAPILFLIFPINSLVIIQQTILQRQMDFKRLSIYNFAASTLSSIAAIWMAVAGMGLWALVAQRLLIVVTKTVLLWTTSHWRPRALFSMESIKSMFRYSSRILLSDIISNVYYQIQPLLIGKIYTSSQTGYYDRGNKIKELPVSSTITAVNGVAFPALAKLRGDEQKMADSARKILIVWAFVLFPLMAGLIMTCSDMFLWLLPERWMNSIPYLQILSVAGFMSPLSVISFVIVKVCSDGKMIFRIELFKKLFATAVLIVTVPISVKAIAWGQVVIFVSDMLINTFAAHRLLPSWRIGGVLRSLLPYGLLTLAMAGAIWGIGMVAGPLNAGWLFAIKVVVGVSVYLLLSILTNAEAWHETKQIMIEYAAKLRGRH